MRINLQFYIFANLRKNVGRFRLIYSDEFREVLPCLDFLRLEQLWHVTNLLKYIKKALALDRE